MIVVCDTFNPCDFLPCHFNIIAFFIKLWCFKPCLSSSCFQDQKGYLKEIFKHFFMEDCKAIKVPLDPKMKLKKNMGKDVKMVGVF